MVTTSCNNCGSIEHSLASIGSKCYFCNNGTMRLMELGSYNE